MKQGILKYCKDCDDKIPVEEFYVCGNRYSHYCRQHTRARKKPKNAVPRRIYAFNEPRPCLECSPETPLAPDNFYVGRGGYRRNSCKACVGLKVKLQTIYKHQAATA